MIASPHVSAGAAIGTAVEKFFPEKPKSLKITATLILGIFSHLLMDAIPHSEIYTDNSFLNLWGVLLVELSLVFFCVFKFAISKPYKSFSNLVVLSGTLGAMILDVLKLFTDFFQADWRITNLINQFHLFIHSRQEVDLWPGVAFQILVTVAFFFIIKRIRSQTR